VSSAPKSAKPPSAPKPGRLYPERPIIGCLAVVRRGGKVLLAQRSLPPGVGKWGFPGGMQELGETLFECARRELIEETAISAEPRSVLTAIEAIRQDEKGKIMTHFTLVCVLLDWRQGEGEPLEDAQRVGWFSVAEAEVLDSFPDTMALMRLALANP
jgi:ADP-ribose pyrophosphatase YjhB (NUDIX family)